MSQPSNTADDMRADAPRPSIPKEESARVGAPQRAEPAGKGEPDKATPSQEPNAAGEGAPQPATQGEAGNPAAAPSNTVTVSAGELSSETTYIANRQDIYRSIKVFLGDSNTAALRTFSHRHALQVPVENERSLSELYIADPVFTDSFLATLCAHGIMVLTGEPEMGKASAAIYLSHRLRALRGETYEGAYMVRTLDMNVKIDFREIIGKPKHFGNRLIVFKDAFEGGNQDVLDFFTRMDKHSLGAFAASLQKNQTFLVFTADSQTVRVCEKQMAGLNIMQELVPLNEDLLWLGLGNYLKQYAVSRKRTVEDVAAILTDEQKEALVRRLRTMPRIVQFVEHFLEKVVDGLDFGEALSRVDTLRNWLATDLTEDFDLFCFALSLALCQCLPFSPGVPWVEFTDFCKTITAYLRRELRVPARREFHLKESISEEGLLERCRAEVYKDLTTDVDYVKFVNERYPEMLWDVLLKSHRRILTLLLPKLKELAQEGSPRVRSRAAQVIGRIGEIDPPHVIFSTIREWIASDTDKQKATVGYLYQGIYASGSDRYKCDCLRVLESLCAEDGKRRKDKQKEVWTAIAAYKQIGVYDLHLAMGKFKKVIESRLTGTLEDTNRIDRLLDRIENVVASRYSSLEAIDSMAMIALHKLLSEIAVQTFSEEDVILDAIQYAIVSLCVSRDPISVIAELQKWVTPDKPVLGAFVALIFLQQYGIADELERKSVEVPDSGGAGQPTRCNSIVISLASSEAAVRQMADFLRAIFERFFDFFPPRSRRYFRKALLHHLKTWAQHALPVDSLRAAMVQLYAELLLISGKELADEIYNFMESDSDFNDPDSDLQKFKKAVKRLRADLETVRFTF